MLREPKKSERRGEIEHRRGNCQALEAAANRGQLGHAVRAEKKRKEERDRTEKGTLRQAIEVTAARGQSGHAARAEKKREEKRDRIEKRRDRLEKGKGENNKQRAQQVDLAK